METHAENDVDGFSLDMLLDVVHEICHRKLRCTFEGIFASCRQQHKKVSRNAVAALLETAVMEKKVEKIVTNNLLSYRVLLSNECCVIGEVLTAEVAHSGKRVCDSVQNSVVKHKTRSLLHRSRSVGLRRKTCQKRGISSGGKNLRHDRYKLRSSGEFTAEAADKPLRRSLKRCRQHSMCTKQADVDRQASVADCNDNITVKAANKSFTSLGEEFKRSENLCHSTAKTSHPDKSCIRRKSVSAVARKTTARNRARSQKSVQMADTTAATSTVVDSHISVRQPVVNLRRVESLLVEDGDKRPNSVDDRSTVGGKNSGEKDGDDSSGFLAITGNTPFHRPASASALHDNRFSEVKTTLP